MVIIRGMSIADFAIMLVVIGAIVALVIVAARKYEIAIPSWVINVLSILFVAAVIIFAIRLLVAM